MFKRALVRVILLVLITIGAVSFATGIRWGLPTRAADSIIFGSHPVWSGQEIIALAPGWSDPDRGADVDSNPLEDRQRATELNASDAQRAEIVRRYRLFSAQPDEMITFRSLAGMQLATRQFDPKLYQYGGLWIYPVGALLKALVNPRSDLSFYLDNPEAFGRFYVVARLYSAAWGVVGVAAVFWLTRRLSGSLVGAIVASLCYIFMPVVVNMAHEAKPHLPSAVLTLLAMISGINFIDTQKTRWWLLAGLLCGAAAGMVLSAVSAVVIIPAMALLAPVPWRRRFAIVAGASVMALLIYFISNPYVAAHLLGDRTILRSNLQNSSAMYQFGNLAGGFFTAIFLVREGASLPILVSGLISTIALLFTPAVRRPLWLIVIPSLVVVVQFVGLAAGKPGEYGRFAILPDISLAIVTAAAIGVFIRRDIDRVVVGILIVALTAVPGWFYLAGFARDSSDYPTRLEGAEALDSLRIHGGARTLAIFAEPAPYSLPPINLFEWKILLMPGGAELADALKLADVVVRPVDALSDKNGMIDEHVRTTLNRHSKLFPARISWASKPFEVWVRREILDQASAPASSP